MSNKIAIRKLKRLPNGQMTVVYVDASTGLEVMNLDGYTFGNMDGDTSLPGSDSTEQPTEKTEETPEEEKIYESDSGSIFDNDLIFDNPDIPFREAVRATPTKPKEVAYANPKAATDNPIKPSVNAPVRPNTTPTKSEIPSPDLQPRQMANLDVNISKAGRNQMPTTDIADRVRNTVTDVLGPDYTVELHSGMEPKGLAAVGSNRHVEGFAGDFKIYDPQGKLVSPSDPRMKDVAQAAAAQWGANVGLGPEYMSQSIHLDQMPPEMFSSKQGPQWGSVGRSMAPVLSDSRQSALMPESYYNKMTTNPPVPESRPDPMSVEMKSAERVKSSIGEPKTPAQFAAMGYASRTPEEKSVLSYALAGELSPGTLEAASLGDPNAIQEVANMIGSIENRAVTKGTTLDKELSGSQVNSMFASKQSVTSGNYQQYKETMDSLVNDFYSGNLYGSLTQPKSTHWANMSSVSPDWANYAKSSAKVGDHTFFSDLTTKDRSRLEYNLPTFTANETRTDKEARESVNRTVKDSWVNKSGQDIASSPPSFGNYEKDSKSSSDDTYTKDSKSSNAQSVRDDKVRDTINNTVKDSWTSNAGRDIASSPPSGLGGSKPSKSTGTTSKNHENTTKDYQ